MTAADVWNFLRTWVRARVRLLVVKAPSESPALFVAVIILALVVLFLYVGGRVL